MSKTTDLHPENPWHPDPQPFGYVTKKLTPQEEKLLAFHTGHGTAMEQMLADLQTAIDQLPRSAHAEEVQPLAEELRKIEHGRKRENGIGNWGQFS